VQKQCQTSVHYPWPWVQNEHQALTVAGGGCASKGQ